MRGRRVPRGLRTWSAALALACGLGVGVVVPVTLSIGAPQAESAASRAVPAKITAPAAAAPRPRNAASGVVLPKATSRAQGPLPLAFEVNRGQAEGGVRFVTHAGDASVSITSSGATLAFNHSSASRPAARGPVQPLATPATSDVLSIEAVGGASTTPVTGVQALPGVVNYYVGNDPAKWLRGVPTYSQVQSDDVLPGVDMAWYGTDGDLEYDLTLAPGVVPASVRLAYRGARKLSLTPAGDLAVQLPSGTLIQKAPHLYQEVAGVRHPVSGGLVLLGGDEIGFRVGAYDHALPLVIDPSIVYSTYLGGSGDDSSNGVAVDGAGDAYAVGSTVSSDFPEAPSGGVSGACVGTCGRAPTWTRS